MPTPIEWNLNISKEMCLQTDYEKGEMENRPYRVLLVDLIYLAKATTSEIAFPASTFNCFCANPGYKHWLIAKRVLRYLRATSHYAKTYVKSNEKL